MAPTATANLVFALFFASSICIQATLGEITCETLLKDKCAFAVASSGDRCVLETYTTRGGFTEYQCKTSGVVADEKLAGYIETDECVSACGVERKSVGMGSDSLLEPTFLAKLCSPQCYQNCPNIVDLYFNLAAGEGGFLPDLCKAQGGHHRAMTELMSSGEADKYWQEAAYAPVPSQSMDHGSTKSNHVMDLDLDLNLDAKLTHSRRRRTKFRATSDIRN